MDVGQIGHPDLVHTVYQAIGDQVGIDRQPMAAIGGGNPVAGSPAAHPIVLTHDARDFLVVDVQAFALELMSDAPIAVTRILQADLLNAIEQGLITGSGLGPMVVNAPSY